MINQKSLVRMIGAAALTAALVPSLASAALLTRQLQFGSTGSDVSSLQTFLAQDSSVYPQGLVTGYFGPLTKSAVMRFQANNDIPVVGRVGPITLGVINAQMMGGVSTGADLYAPTIWNVAVGTSTNSATVSWNTSENAKGLVYYSNAPLMTTEYLHSVSVSSASAMSDTNFHVSHSVSLPNLSANTVYYYMVQSTDASGNVSVSFPSMFKTAN